MSHLLDINFVVTLFDPRHVNHNAAHHWFRTWFSSDWATYSMTEAGCNGWIVPVHRVVGWSVLRILQLGIAAVRTLFSWLPSPGLQLPVRVAIL